MAGKQSALAEKQLTLALVSVVRLLPDRRRRVGCGVCNMYDGSRQGDAMVALGSRQYELSIKGMLFLLRP